MTSNVGAEMIRKTTQIGFAVKRDEQTEAHSAYEDMRKKLTEALRKVFRPEFLNRVDATVVFHALTREQIGEIVDLELAKVAERLGEHQIHLRATEEARLLLADLGYDPEMGARPLKRVIQSKVEDRLSDALLSGEFKDGDRILIDAADKEVVLRPDAGEPADHTAPAVSAG
jgi:ATP-dependent Clp protease ATP-binding subunit ClpC